MGGWLEKSKHEVFTASSPDEALDLAQKHEPHLILVELVLDGIDGIEFVTRIREELFLYHTTVVVMSERSEAYTQVAAFNSGADDFVLKPLKRHLFEGKVKAWTRRFNGKTTTVLLNNQLEGLQIDPDTYAISMFNQDMVLPKKEFDILNLLLSKPGKVFTRDEIQDTVWTKKARVRQRTIDVHIHRLRDKLGDVHIRTIKGVGYRFEF